MSWESLIATIAKVVNGATKGTTVATAKSERELTQLASVLAAKNRGPRQEAGDAFRYTFTVVDTPLTMATGCPPG